MPLMMEDDQYMEDLFGDSETVQLPTFTTLKGLSQRLDELQESGCCQKIAWSKAGGIATITRDGRGITLRALVRNPENGKWELSDEIPIQIPESHDDHCFVHLAWSYMGNDLAVVDDAGRIMIFSTETVLGKMNISRSSAVDSEDELGAIVGLYWLPVAPHKEKSAVFWSGQRDSDQWVYRMSHHLPAGPHNPVQNRSALVCVTRSGTVRLLYQQVDGQWLETVTELENITTASETLTHASFTEHSNVQKAGKSEENDDSLFLAIHDTSGLVRLYRIKINWNGFPQQPNQTPAFATMSLKTEDHCFPSRPSGEFDGQNLPSSRQLTYLEMIPIALEQREVTSLTIMAVFSSAPMPPSLMDTTQQAHSPSSVIVRWDFQQTMNKLHPSFDQLSSKKKPATSIDARKSFVLKRHPDVVTNNVVLAVFPLIQNTLYAFYLGDGSVEFRSRNSMEPVAADYNNDLVSSLPQAGFGFPIDEAGIQTALSPNFCLAAVMKADGSVHLKRMEYTLGSLATADDDPKYSAAAAAIALQHGSACYQYFISDDLFAMIPEDISPSFRRKLLSLIYKGLNNNLDFTAEETQQRQSQNLFRSPTLHKCLSAQCILGSSTPFKRDYAAKVSWVTMNIRLSTYILTMTVKNNQPLDADVAISVVGIIRWCGDLMAYLIGELMDAANALRGHEDDLEAIHAHIVTTNSPALPLLLSSIPRLLLRYALRPLRYAQGHAAQAAKNATPTAATRAARAAFATLLQLSAARPVQPPVFDELIGAVDSAIRNAYKDAGLDEKARGFAERELLTRGEVPGPLAKVVKSLLTEMLDKTISDASVDAARVRWTDTVTLGVTDDEKARRWWKSHTWDIIRKCTLPEGRRLRRCARCCGVMEDAGPVGSVYGKDEKGSSAERGGLHQWVYTTQKICVCSGSWGVGGFSGVGK
ncbi:hypothetical protein M501DRAFT_998516 [Patellaria atrata CBS 101060]|uniref:Mediator of RNA polymerase II transcription subunit 16 n=1 Tax=Patellaria atrata CBS 101060 TaxID=1346257 RepID=A0A9P4SGT9_9PEZI|nr:hypothetical protein M501DRAFT_998516 [Patellaria atrata CBS 101060]